MQIELLCSYKYKTLNPAGYKISFSQAVLYSFWCKWKRDIKLLCLESLHLDVHLNNLHEVKIFSLI